MSTPCSSPTPPPAGPPPPNYIVWGVLATCVCCIVAGLLAIIKGSQVNGLWAAGRHAEARAASVSARNWCILSTLLGVAQILAMLYLLNGAPF